MTTLKNLKGTAIQFLDADPVVYAGSWSSGGSVNTARQYGAGIGSSTAGLIFGGSSPPVVANTEQYNGTAWTEVNDLNAAQNAQASAGTLTSGMSALGAQSPGANVEDWNGSTWSANPHSLNSARQFPGGDGASNDSAIMVGGEPAPNGALTEIYNGSSWTESGDLNTARNQLAAAGTVTALIAMGGNTGADAETFNGSAWTAVTDMNSGRGGLSGSGTSTLALAFAGNPDVASTESWNGSAWTEVNDLSTGREFGASSNITGNTTAFLASGNTTTLVSNTEEWSFPPPTASVLQEGDMWFNSTSSALKGYGVSIATGTFSSGGQTSSLHLDAAAGGSTQSSFMLISGYPDLPTVEQYDGTSWTEVGDVNTARSLGGASAQAPAPTMLFYGGQEGIKNTEQYNGTSWTEVSELNTNRVYSGGGAGVSTAALCVGGYGSPAAYLTTNEEYNGSTWTEKGDLNNGRYGGATGGSSTSARCVAGAPPGPVGDKNEGWDGTTWSEQTENSDNSAGRAGFGDNKDSFMVASGNSTAQSEFWNGSSWTEVGATAGSGQRFNMGGGTTSAGIIGKCSNPNATSTEEFNTDNVVLTVTTS